MCGSHLSGVTKLRRSMDAALLERVEAEVMHGVKELSLTVAGEPFAFGFKPTEMIHILIVLAGIEHHGRSQMLGPCISR